MIFEEDLPLQRVGEYIGIVCSYLVFTTILFFLLSFLKKLFLTFTSYLYVMAATFLILIIGTLARRYLR